MGLNIDPIYINIAYLFAAITFIIGLKRLSHPRTARTGNQLAAVGMAVAVLATFFNPGIALDKLWLILLGMVLGGGIGLYLARTVEMTAMPQMVALFNGMGGGAAALTSGSEFLELFSHLGPTFRGAALSFDFTLATVLGVVIGGMSLSGSFIALGKLQGFITARPVTYAGQQIVNGLLAL